MSDETKIESQMDTFQLIKELELPCQSHKSIIKDYESKNNLNKIEISNFIKCLNFEYNFIRSSLKQFG